LYFDSVGRLVRLVRFVDTAIGRIPIQIDYDDYRDVAGIKFPYKITSTWTDGQFTVELTEVQANVQIPPARLAQPAPAKTKSVGKKRWIFRKSWITVSSAHFRSASSCFAACASSSMVLMCRRWVLSHPP